MYVPNYVPDPIEVPDNVTERPYAVRIRFVRIVSLLQFGALSLVGALAYAPISFPNIEVSLYALVLAIVVASIVRILFRRKRFEARISAALLPLILTPLASVVANLAKAGWPVWAAVTGVAFAVVYAMLCGRDFSFVGQFMLSLIASSVLIAGMAVAAAMSPFQAKVMLGVNAAYLFYFVYDSASLLSRRRVGEELAAVTDLQRDVLNIFGYIPRVIGHWRKHRIFVSPRWPNPQS